MNNELSDSSNKMSNEKKRITDGGKRERLLEDSQDQGNLQTLATLPDRTSHFMRISILKKLQLSPHHLQILLLQKIFHKSHNL